MNLKYMDFNKRLNSLTLAPMDSGCIAAAGLALAVSRIIDIPTAPSENIEQHYLLTVKPLVNKLLSDANESVIFDVRECVELVKKFWMVRYTCVYPATRSLLVANYGFFDTIAGVGNFIDEDTHKFVNNYKMQILELATLAEVLLKVEEAQA